MWKCSDCKHVKVPGVSCSKDDKKGVADLLETFGIMASGFCSELELRKEEERDDDD